LKKTFAPEFLNRIDDIIIFNSLKKEDIIKIIDIVLKDVMARIEKLGFNLSLSESAKEFLAEKGYDPLFGARPLHRAIQKYLEDPLAELILANGNEPGLEIRADFNKEENRLDMNVLNNKKVQAS